MARKTATAIENNFIQGLITEKTALTFPENACFETENCIFNNKGNVTRREGIDVENTTYTLTSKTDTQSYKTYLWESVAGTGNVSLLVVQAGRYLYFYDQSTSTVVTDNKKSFFIDLESRRPATSNLLPSEYDCAFATGNGDLFVVNYACDPFFVSYSPSLDTITVSTITLQARDFDGYDDGLTINQRPIESIATLKTNNPEHYYNLLNQGWHSADALSQWDTALTSLPSNADQVALFRASDTDAFDATRVTAKSPGNSPAPKGHFILSVANPDRVAAAAGEGYTFSLATTDVVIPSTTGTVYTDFTSNTSAANDGTTIQASAASATKYLDSYLFSGGFIGRSFSTPVTVSRVTVSGSNDHGYINSGTTTNVRLELYGKAGSAAPVLLGFITFNQSATNESAARTINSSNTTSLWDKVWINVVKPAVSTDAIYVAELTIYSSTSASASSVNIQRPTAVAFLGSRVFYSGLDIQGETNKVWFSQIVVNKEEYGRCYQKNDPTSEDYFELLSDDGGVIKILEIGTILRLFPLRSSLVIFASNGVWLIGGTNGALRATDYSIKKLSGVGTTSPYSIIDVKGMPVWWAEDGIYTMQYDPNYDSFQLVNLSQSTIKSLIVDIPQLNRKFITGTYDTRNEVIMWMYNDSSSLSPENYRVYNRVLCLNTITKAFYTWTIEPVINKLRSVIYVQDAQRLNEPKIKYLTTVEISTTQEVIFFAEAKDNIFLDWTILGTYYSSPSAIVDYSSYFITGFKIHGETQKFFQPGYCFVFLNQLDNSSCYMHTRHDYTSDSSEGKWSSIQQVYNPALTNRYINFRRLKVRGKGRAMQIKFESETGKPFDIIGWSMREGVNSDI